VQQGGNFDNILVFGVKSIMEGIFLGANLNPQLIALLQQQQQEALLQGLNPQQSGLLLQQQQQQQQAALLQQQQQAALLQQQQQAAFLQQQQQQQQTPGLQQGSNPQVALILQNPQAVAILQSLTPQQVAVILQSPQAALIMQNLIQQQQAASILQSPQSGQLFQSQNPTLQLQGGQVPFGGIQNAGIQGPVQGFQRPVQNFQRPVQNFQGSFQDPNQIIVRQDFSNPQIFQYNPGFQTTGFYPFVQTVQTYPTPIFQGQPFNQQNQQFGTYPGGTQGFGSNKFSVNDNQVIKSILLACSFIKSNKKIISVKLAINYLNEKHSRLPRHPFKMTNYSEDESNPNFSVYGGSRQLFQVEGNQSTDQTEKDIENEAFSY